MTQWLESQTRRIKKIGSEIIHILLDTLPPTNITGVYQETGITNEEADEAHMVPKNKVKKCVVPP